MLMQASSSCSEDKFRMASLEALTQALLDEINNHNIHGKSGNINPKLYG